MPSYFSTDAAIAYLQSLIVNNKARGMIAEIELENFVHRSQKFLSGAWIISPKTPQFYQYRYAVFVLPELYRDDQEITQAVDSWNKNRSFQAIATFLNASGIGVIVSGAIGSSTTIDQLSWQNYLYADEQLNPSNNLFDRWPKRGRSARGNSWHEDIKNRFSQASEAQLTALTLRQAFYYSYLKQHLHKSLADPYDVDLFIAGFRGTVLPVEVKEKSPTERGDFGLDAGRILMMLRLCLATQSNGMYVIRQVDADEQRSFVAWRYTLLSDIVMGCSWNLQAGGRGMLGGMTQTVMLSGELFKPFHADLLTEDWLQRYGDLTNSVCELAGAFAKQLSAFLP